MDIKYLRKLWNMLYLQPCCTEFPWKSVHSSSKPSGIEYLIAFSTIRIVFLLKQNSKKHTHSLICSLKHSLHHYIRDTLNRIMQASPQKILRKNIIYYWMKEQNNVQIYNKWTWDWVLESGVFCEQFFFKIKMLLFLLSNKFVVAVFWFCSEFLFFCQIVQLWRT